MTKEQLMKLADTYSTESLMDGSNNCDSNLTDKARQALSDAIDATLAKARKDALEEAAKRVEAWPFGDVAAAIRALKEQA